MWILIRLILAAVGFVIRLYKRRRTLKDPLMLGELRYFSQIHEHKGKTKGFTLSMERTTPTWIRFHSESAADRAFKAMGVANEIQTGDDEFDRSVYVTCDHPHVASVLRETPALRHAILAMLQSGYDKIHFDGTYVRAHKRCDYTPTDAEVEKLKAVWETSWRLSDAPPSRLADPFLWKALVVEGVIWSIGGYAIGSGIDRIFHAEDLHADHGALWKLGLMVAGAALVVLLAVIVFWMRGSSRGHRVIVESVIVLAIGLPFASVQAVGDTNRALDSSAPQLVERAYSECEIRKRRSRRSTRYSYHLHLQPEAEGVRLPSTIEIDRALCHAAGSSPGLVTIELGAGRWGVPWYRSIRIGGETWTSPL